MTKEITTYYLINKDGKHSAVELLHYIDNARNAERDMMLEIGLSNKDIKTRTSGRPSWTKTNSLKKFDGRNALTDGEV